MKYTSTILSISVHPTNDHPVFGEYSTHIRIEDDAGGPYIVMTQCHDEIQPGELRLDFEEINAIVDAINKLKSQPVIEELLRESNQDPTV